MKFNFNSEDLASIVGDEYEPYWAMLMPTLYYRDGKPHGTIAVHRDGNMNVVYSMAKDDEFTIGMLRDIIKLYNEDSICLVTDYEASFGKIKKVLSRYDFEFVKGQMQDGKKLMYSIHIKGV